MSRLTGAAFCLFLLSFQSLAAPFARVQPGRPFSFPADHSLHEDFQSEWWYVTANLKGNDGKDYGAQFTLFSNALVIGDKPRRIYFAHAAASGPAAFFHGERYARADMKHGGQQASPWLAFLDHWQYKGTGPNPLPGTIVVAEPSFGYRLNLSGSPYFLQGDKGFSKKNSDGSLASYYYNAPFITVTGELNLAGKKISVTGEAWLDREFSSGIFTGDNFASSILNTIGWDWLSLHLDQQTALMLYRVRSSNEVYLDGVVMHKNGEKIPLNAEQIDWRPERYQAFGEHRYPVTWQLNIPSQNIDIAIEPINDDQLMQGTMDYWEGAVTTRGSHAARGYLELVGY